MNSMIPHPTLKSDILIDDQTSIRDLMNSIEVKLKFRGYSEQTFKAYQGQVRAFLRFLAPKDPRQVDLEDLQRYLSHLNNENRSRSTIDQVLNALRYVWEEVRGEPLSLKEIQRPGKKARLPVFLTLDEIKSIAIAAENLKHRLMIELSYSAGLRVSEVVTVRVRDVNLTALALYVKGDRKGDKLRKTIFSSSLKDALARQIGNKKPEDYLFPSERGGKLTTRAFTKYFKAALRASGVKKNATPHSLRHSFANYLLQQGTDVPTLQNLLGHVRKESTSFYAKIYQTPATLIMPQPAHP